MAVIFYINITAHIKIAYMAAEAAYGAFGAWAMKAFGFHMAWETVIRSI